MGLIPQVTCRRCKHKYSALRQRCPKCNTRIVRQSSRVPGTTPDTVKGTAANAKVAENRKWLLIFGAILIAAVIIAFIVMITVSVNNADSNTNNSTPDIPEMTAVPTPAPTSAPTPAETPEITQLQIYYYSDDKTGSGFTATVGSKTPLIPRWYPQNLLDVEYSWSSSDESVATIGDDGVVQAVSTGTATITLTCYGMSVQTTVYVRG
ncbi:MAG: Ig-like domain-containing protein [Bacillota bacterium]|nr:Ig-like domain-containing protein [Bacillota bacterium]